METNLGSIFKKTKIVLETTEDKFDRLKPKDLDGALREILRVQGSKIPDEKLCIMAALTMFAIKLGCPTADIGRGALTVADIERLESMGAGFLDFSQIIEARNQGELTGRIRASIQQMEILEASASAEESAKWSAMAAIAALTMAFLSLLPWLYKMFTVAVS